MRLFPKIKFVNEVPTDRLSPMEQHQVEIGPCSLWGTYRRKPYRLICVKKGKGQWGTLRHELCHWLVDILGFPWEHKIHDWIDGYIFTKRSRL